MSDLDPMAQAANGNNPKLSAKAARAEFWEGFRRNGAATWRWTLKYVPKVLLGAVLIAIFGAGSIFEWWMAARGWKDILPGLGAVAYLGAALGVGSWYFSVHKVRVEHAKKDLVERNLWVAVAVVSYLLCVSGVAIATITNTGEAKQAAQESRKELSGLTAERDTLKASLEDYPVDYFVAMLAQTNRAFDAQKAIARSTFGLPDLDIDGGCAGVFDKTKPDVFVKLNFRQERACVYANGGVDPTSGQVVKGTRAEIEDAGRALLKAQADAGRLDAVTNTIKTFDLKTGDATASALADFVGGEDNGNRALLILFVFLSSGTLFCGGLFGDFAVRLMLGKVK